MFKYHPQKSFVWTLTVRVLYSRASTLAPHTVTLEDWTLLGLVGTYIKVLLAALKYCKQHYYCLLTYEQVLQLRSNHY